MHYSHSVACRGDNPPRRDKLADRTAYIILRRRRRRRRRGCRRRRRGFVGRLAADYRAVDSRRLPVPRGR